MKKLKIKRPMTVQCGSLVWQGTAKSADNAIIAALSKNPPESPSSLLRVHDGKQWAYIAFKSALKIAGYRVVDIPSLEGGGFYIE